MNDEDNREEEFESLFEKTSRMIYNLGLRLFRNNEEDALDFSQEVYLQAYKKFQQFRGESRFSTWLYSLAMNLGLNRLKKEKRYETTEKEPEDIAEDSDFSGEVIQAETERIVQIEIHNLPDKYRMPLLLFYYERMQYREIGENLGIPEGTVKSYIYRGKLILKKKLQDYYNT